MSLKTFHIIFITASIILCLGFGAWGLRAYGAYHHRTHLVMGVGSLLCAAALIVYERAVLRKFKQLRYV
jgi:hypothetical protein